MSKDDPYLQQLYRDLDYSSTEFDKSLTYVSSGILAVSYAFIDKIIDLKTSVHNEILVRSWVVIAVSIFLALLAHYVSIYFQKLAIKHYEPTDTKKQKFIRKWSWILIGSLNIINVILIFVGSLILFYFININLTK